MIISTCVLVDVLPIDTVAEATSFHVLPFTPLNLKQESSSCEAEPAVTSRRADVDNDSSGISVKGNSQTFSIEFCQARVASG